MARRSFKLGNTKIRLSLASQSVQVSLRLPKYVVDLVERVVDDTNAKSGAEVTSRSDVLQYVILNGIGFGKVEYEVNRLRDRAAHELTEAAGRKDFGDSEEDAATLERILAELHYYTTELGRIQALQAPIAEPSGAEHDRAPPK